VGYLTGYAPPLARHPQGGFARRAPRIGTRKMGRKQPHFAAAFTGLLLAALLYRRNWRFPRKNGGNAGRTPLTSVAVAGGCDPAGRGVVCARGRPGEARARLGGVAILALEEVPGGSPRKPCRARRRTGRPNGLIQKRFVGPARRVWLRPGSDDLLARPPTRRARRPAPHRRRVRASRGARPRFVDAHAAQRDARAGRAPRLASAGGLSQLIPPVACGAGRPTSPGGVRPTGSGPRFESDGHRPAGGRDSVGVVMGRDTEEQVTRTEQREQGNGRQVARRRGSRSGTVYS